jgi:hypothetical protein
VGNHRVDAFGRDRAQHVLEIFPVPARHPLQAHLAHDSERQIYRCFGARQDADQRDRSAGPDQAQRGIQRFRPADLDDQIDGIGEFPGTPRPIGLVAVIDDRVGAEFGELGGLRLAGLTKSHSTQMFSIRYRVSSGGTFIGPRSKCNCAI